MIIRLRSKDGLERINVPSDGTPLKELRQLIEGQLKIPLAQQLLSRQPGGKEPFGPADDNKSMKQLGIDHGCMLHVVYDMERDVVVEGGGKNDAFKSLAKNGELRQQGKTEWTLTDYLAFRSTREFALTAPPEPHCTFASVDVQASNNYLNYVTMMGFSTKRFALLYGRWTEDNGVQVDAIYELQQESTEEEIVLTETEEMQAKVEAITGHLGLKCVGCIFCHGAREYAFGVNEVILAAQLHNKAVAADEVNGKKFVVLKARPVYEDEEIEGVATVEAYQMTDLCRDLVEKKAFYQSKTDPQWAKTEKDFCFVVEKKEQRKATTEHFVSRVFDMSKPYDSPLSCQFPPANRPDQPQGQYHLKEYLMSRRNQPFQISAADLHLIIYLSTMLDMRTDMPVLCQAIAEGNGEALEGFQIMINCYAGLD